MTDSDCHKALTGMPLSTFYMFGSKPLCTPETTHRTPMFHLFCYLSSYVLSSGPISVPHTNHSRPPHLRAIRYDYILFSAGKVRLIELDTTHRDVPCIPQQDTPFHCQRVPSGTLPLHSTACLLFLANVPINCPLLSVEDNLIAVLDKCDWSP